MWPREVWRGAHLVIKGNHRPLREHMVLGWPEAARQIGDRHRRLNGHNLGLQRAPAVIVLPLGAFERDGTAGGGSGIAEDDRVQTAEEELAVGLPISGDRVGVVGHSPRSCWGMWLRLRRKWWLRCVIGPLKVTIVIIVAIVSSAAGRPIELHKSSRAVGGGRATFADAQIGPLAPFLNVNHTSSTSAAYSPDRRRGHQALARPC